MTRGHRGAGQGPTPSHQDGNRPRGHSHTGLEGGVELGGLCPQVGGSVVGVWRCVQHG